MPARARWSNVRGTGNRIYDPLERAIVGLFDAPGRLAAGLLSAIGLHRQGAPLTDDADVREVLVLRLDRIGDVAMSLPALADLRRALPNARLRLAVGRWSRDVAKSAPVDEVLEWSAPWVGRASEGADSALGLAQRAWALREQRLDLAIDLQGDVRANLLLRLSGARARVGYANTGGGWLLTHVVALDEDVTWVEQNRRALEVALGPVPRGRLADPLTADERAAATEVLERLGAPQPRIGVHPAGGRLVKQWPVERWAEVAGRLQQEFGACVLLTGSSADAALCADLAARLPERPLDLSGRLSVRETLALIEQLDLYLSPDTGTMHLACLVGTPSVSVFGPSDPGRYFSGAALDPADPPRHLVVHPDLWCSPCNLIRKPPNECGGPAPPECLGLVSVVEVHRAAVRLLQAGGFVPRA